MTETTPAPAAEEPSIEEILASIRKIISDEPGADGAEVAAPPAENFASFMQTQDRDEDDEVLDLTAFQAAPVAEHKLVPVPVPQKDLDLELEDNHAAPFDNLLPKHLEQGAARASEPADTGIASDRTLNAAAAAMAKLQRAAEPSYATSTQLWVGARTIEQLVEDLLRPILKTWLDQNLPKLVERLVEKEVARMSKRIGE